MSANYVDQKREDAVELLRTIAALPGGEPPTPPTFHFAHNSSFMTLYGRDRRVRRGQTEVPLEAIQLRRDPRSGLRRPKLRRAEPCVGS